jgi:hypothetical protein
MQMKRTLMALMIAAVAAGTAYAQEGNDEQEGHGGKSWNHGNGDQQGWNQRDERGDQDRGNGDRQEWKQDRRGGKQAWGQDKRDGDRPSGPMDQAMMEQMRTYHKAIKDLGDAARAETDEAKKAEIVAQLRTKIGEVSDLMQKKWEERLTQAEGRLAELKAKIEESKANRDGMIDEQVKRILSGEKLQHHGGFPGFPNAKGGMPEGGPACGGMPPPPAGNGEIVPPPPAEAMPGEMAPPPAE